MKKLLLLLALVLIPSLVSAQHAPEADIWAKGAYGTYSPGITHVGLNGYSAGLTTSFELIWPEGTAYTLLAVNMSIPYIASSSTADDVGSTGALTVLVECVDANFTATSATLSLDGQTSVLLGIDCMAVNSVKVLTVGSGGVNAGILRVGTGTNTSGVPAVVHAHVAIGDNQSKAFFYTVPDNYTLLCKDIIGSVGTSSAIAYTFAINSAVNMGPSMRRRLIYNTYADSARFGDLIMAFPEKSQVTGLALAASGSGPVAMNAQCLLVSNNVAAPLQPIF